jgi:hypothetical protein
MFNKIVVQEALRRSWALETRNGSMPVITGNEQDTVNSLLIHDIFGGEILKTPKKDGWHFYNRINGETIDFIISESDKSSADNMQEDILSTPEETHDYFEEVDYSTFFMRFVGAFEEVVGLC